MEKGQKERLVAELTARLREAQTLMVADYRGLSMTEIDNLRTELLKHGARFRVVKNTLTRRAAEAAGQEALLALLEGPTAIAFLESDGDPVAVAKALSEAARTTRILAIRGGLLDGRPMSEEDVASLAKLPPVDILRGQVLGAILAPLHAIAGLVNAPLQNLYGLIDARIEQLGGEAVAAEEQAETPAAPPAEPQAKAEVETAPAEEEGAAEEAPSTAPGEAPSSEEPQASADAETGQTQAAELPVEEPPEIPEESPEDDADASSSAEETEEE
jgi:large subunit ribosomal protein L10